MFKGLQTFLYLLVIVLPTVISVFEKDRVVFAQEDEVEGEEEDVLDDYEAEVDDDAEGEVEAVDGEEEEEEEDPHGPKGSPNADTTILFTKPTGTGEELPAGKLVEFLVGFTNNGDQDFTLDAIDASFRYPMDFSFYIQNFTAIPYNRAVKPQQEATLMYSFYPAEAFAGRPLGLTINLAYHDGEGNMFVEAVFNQTVTITEVDEGLDGETFFLYVFLLAFGVLLLVAGHHFLSSFGRKKGSKKPAMEMGTTNRNDVDYDWIPKEMLDELKKTPRQSPRQRKAKRESGSD